MTAQLKDEVAEEGHTEIDNPVEHPEGPVRRVTTNGGQSWHASEEDALAELGVTFEWAEFNSAGAEGNDPNLMDDPMVTPLEAMSDPPQADTSEGPPPEAVTDSGDYDAHSGDVMREANPETADELAGHTLTEGDAPGAKAKAKSKGKGPKSSRR